MDNRFFNEKQLARVFPLFIVYEAIFGVVQFVQTGEIAQVKGHFDNSIGFAMALSFSVPFLLHTIKNDSKFFVRYAVVVLGIIFVALFISASRSGLFTSIILMILYNIRSIRDYWDKCDSIVRTISFLLLVFVIFVSYWLKQDSANGRLLIWGTALDMLWKQPWGYGLGGVAREYMNSQAIFLSRIQDAYWLNLADNLNRVFNEYLAVGIELGIGSMLLVLIIFLYTIKCILIEQNEEKKLFQAALLVVLFISLFSYPLYYPVSWVVIGYSVCRLTTCGQYFWGVKPTFIIKYGIILLLILFIFYQRSELHEQKQWFLNAHTSLSGDTSVLMNKYPRLYRKLKNYPIFLYNYGAELHYAGKYDMSNSILSEYLQKVADYDAWLLVANNFDNQGFYLQALEALHKAEMMCPGRFFPLYRQMNIFKRIGDHERAIRMANVILDKKIKVPSVDIEQMKREALYILQCEKGL